MSTPTQNPGLMRFTRRRFLACASGGLAGMLAAQSSGQTRRAAPPNILFLFTDDQRFNTLHALNNPAVQTPNMDRLVRRGTSFTHACIMGGTIGAVCAPSRAMLMTGQSLFHVDASIVSPGQWPDSARRPYSLFPEVFAQAGYRTFGTGKWHNGPRTFARCFPQARNVFFGGMADHAHIPVQDFDPTGKYPQDRAKPGNKFSSELFSDAAVQFLEAQKPGGPPFLAYVAYTAPHDPRMAPKKYLDMYPLEKIELPRNFLPRHPFDNGEMKVRDEELLPWPRTPEAVRREIAGYYAMITEVDEQIGRVLDALEQTGRADNTIVVFAADNGLALGQHGLLGKQNLYDHSVRVPLVLAGPGIKAGQRSGTLCYLMDLFPTLCDLTGLKTPGTVEGQSLLPALKDPRTQVRDSVLLAYRQVQRAVRTPDWKLIRYEVAGKQTTQLFDLRRDPWEMQNLAGDPRQAERVEMLNRELKQWMKRVDDPLDLDKPDWGRAQLPPARGTHE